MLKNDNSEKQSLPWQAYSLSGAGSGFVTRATTQPFDVLKIRFQLQESPVAKLKSSKYQGILQAIQIIYKEEGVTAFWKGHIPAQYLSIFYGIVQFSVYEGSMRMGQLSTSNPLEGFLVGAISGSAATLFSYPFDVIRTRMVIQGNQKVFQSTILAFKTIIERETLKGLYKGLLPTCLQIAPHTGLQFAFYNSFQTLFTYLQIAFIKNGKRSHTKDTVINFTSGCFSGLFSKLLIYPLDFIKKRLQIVGFNYAPSLYANPRPYTGMIHCGITILKNEGPKAFYKGAYPALLKAFVTTGLHFCLYEQFKHIFKIYYTTY